MKGKEEPIGTVKLEKWNFVNILSKDAINTGRAREKIERIEEIKKAVERLKENRERLVDKVVDFFTEIMKEETQSEMLKREAGKFVETIITNLQQTISKPEVRKEPEEWEEKCIMESQERSEINKSYRRRLCRKFGDFK